jgi:hypothetical protein
MSRRPIVTPLLKASLLATLVCAAFVGSAVRPAVADAKTPCWKALLNDWYDGRIDNTYPVHCYREALQHLPSDVQTYSSAHDDILRALQSAIAKQRQAHKPVSSDTLLPPQTSNGTTTGKTDTSTSGQPGRQAGGGLAGQVSSDNPSSVPTVLYILGGLALLLVAAGAAGLIAKRVQARRKGA